MKLNSVIYVVTLVGQLCDVHSDDGFLDDFFGRFPHLPFQTLYTVHKSQIKPEVEDRNFRHPKRLLVDTRVGLTPTANLGSNFQESDLSLNFPESGLGSKFLESDLGSNFPAWNEAQVISPPNEVESRQVVPFSDEAKLELENKYELELSQGNSFAGEGHNNLQIIPANPVKENRVPFWVQTPSPIYRAPFLEKARPKKSAVSTAHSQRNNPPEQLYTSPDSIGPSGVVDNFAANFGAKKINFKPESRTSDLDIDFPDEKIDQSKKRKIQKRKQVNPRGKSINLDTASQLTNQETPSSYQTISFGAKSSTDEEQDDSWNPTTLKPEIIQEQNVEEEFVEVYSNKPSKFDFNQITAEEFSQQVKDDSPEKSQSYQVVSFGENPHQPLMIDHSAAISTPTTEEEYEKPANESIDQMEKDVNNQGPSNYQVISFGEDPTQPMIDEMYENNKKVKKEATKEQFLMQEQPQEEKTNHLTDNKSPSSYQFVSFGDDPKQTKIDAIFDKKVKKDVTNQQFPSTSKPQMDIMEKLNEMIEKEAPPSSYQFVSFGEKPDGVEEDYEDNQFIKSSFEDNPPDKMKEEVSHPPGKENSQNYQVISFGENPQLSIDNSNENMGGKLEVTKKSPITHKKPYKPIVEIRNPSNYQLISFGDEFQQAPVMESDRTKKSAKFPEFKVKEKEFDEIFGKMHQLVAKNTPENPHEHLSFESQHQKGRKKVKKAVTHHQHIGFNNGPLVEQMFNQKKLLTDKEKVPSSYQFVSFGNVQQEEKTQEEEFSPIEEISPPGLGSFHSEEEEDVRIGSGFKDDFRSVVEMKVRANRLHDKRSLPFPPKTDQLNFPESNFGTAEDEFSPLTESHFFGHNFPQNNFGGHENKDPLVVVVDPLEGFRKPIRSPKIPQAPELEEMPEHFDSDHDKGQIVVGVPLQVSDETVDHRPRKQPQMVSFLSPPISKDEQFPEFGQNFEHNPQFDPIHFEVEDARQSGVPKEQPPFKSKPVNPFTTSNPLNQAEEQPLSPVINADEPSLDDFPDFFKLRPQEEIEPQLDFMTELGHNFQDEHDHAKREQPPADPNQNGVHPEAAFPPQVTESVQPLTIHPRPPMEVQLQRPLDPVTPSSIRGRKNPVRKFIQGWRNVMKPLANGLKMNHNIMGRRSPHAPKGLKFKGLGLGRLGHLGTKRFRQLTHSDPVIVFEGEPSPDSKMFLEDSDDEIRSKSAESHDNKDEIMKTSSTSQQYDGNSESQANREGRVLYDYDDYYDLELADLTDDKLELSVNDRLKNLFSHKLNDPFFQN